MHHFLCRPVRSLCAALFAASMLGALAQRAAADALDVPTPAPEWTKTIGTLRVEKFGSGEPALILVPGLACGSWTYRGTIAHEASHHAVYAVTLAGFDGVPYDGARDTLDAADASIGALIAQENVDRPILVGHSLGGFLALRYGTEHPELLRSVVSIDGLPVLPNLSLETPKAIATFADAYARSVVSGSQAEFEKGELAFIQGFVTDPQLAAKVATLTDRSDRAAIASYGKALFLSDLRPRMESLKVPTLLMAPVPALPLPSYYPAIMSHGDAKSRAQDVSDFYRRLTAGAPLLTIATVQRSRHFIMLDRPGDFISLLDAFIVQH